MLPLMAILFAVLDLSIAIFVKNTVQFAVCQGVRYAITSRTMTGMGQDGAQGLRKLRDGGALTITQDKASSVVYGIPKAAARLNAATEILPLTEIAARIRRAIPTQVTA